jgi:hypothetical protein
VWEEEGPTITGPIMSSRLTVLPSLPGTAGLPFVLPP